jgi:non-heme chloroperoxidase
MTAMNAHHAHTAQANLPRTVAGVDGTALFHLDWGAGQPVVFLSGWALSSMMWRRQMMHLAERGARTIAYDRRGHGRSADPGRGYDYDTLADDLAAVLEQLEVEGAVLVGHSMAGGEIVRYLTRHGADRVRSIVLLGPTLPFPLRTADNPDGYEQEVFGRLRATLIADFTGWLDANAGPYFVPETPAGTIAWTKATMAECSLHAAIGCFDAMVATDFRAEVARIPRPVLIVHGDADMSAPLELTGRKTAALLPQGRLAVYEGAPHGLYVTHGDRLNAELEASVLG